MTDDHKLTFGSLFAGIGGLDLGFERAGMVCKWQVEIDDYATRVLEQHWPHVRRWRDITTFPPDSDRNTVRDEPRRCSRTGRPDSSIATNNGELWNVDIICGGFPCQDISYAGKGAGLDGERSGLFYEAVRVIRTLEPRVAVLENVAALLTRGMGDVLGSLASIGYDCEWHCIPAASVGAPHIRDRAFILATRRRQLADANRRERGVTTGKSSGTCRNWQADEEKGRRGISHETRGEGVREDVADAESERRQQRPGPWISRGWWAVEPDVGRVAHGIPSRVDRLRGLGNAVVPQVAEYIGRRIVESFND